MGDEASKDGQQKPPATTSTTQQQPPPVVTQQQRQVVVDTDDDEDLPKGLPKSVREELREARRIKAQEREARAKVEAEAAAKLAEVDKRVAEEAAKRAQLEQRLVDAELDRQMLEAHPDLRQAEVRDLLRNAYRAHQRDAGDKALALGDWLKSDGVAKHPVYGRLLTSEATVKPPGQQPPPRAPNTERNAGGSETAGSGKLAPEQMGQIARSPSAFRSQRARIKAQLEAERGISIGSWTPPKSG